MALPVNINDLINGRIIEWERIEFKKGWNPEPIIRTICAFANDINNWGGGYIIVGIEEKDGRPILPPEGLNPNQIDNIQKELVNYCNLFTPLYFPVVEPIVFQGRHIIIIWAFGGDNRPYKAPISLGKSAGQDYFVKRFSNTVKADELHVRQLIEMSTKIPFDDCINRKANIDDLDITLIKSFLKDTNSDLYSITDKFSLKDICKRMEIARGPEEYIKPINVGLLLFNINPEKYFPGARIDVVEYEDEIGNKFTEKIFAGPIHIQLRDVLHYLKNQVIKEKIQKIEGQAESLRVFNYPFQAIEEAVVNAVYHKSYEVREPIEINIRHNCIDIISYPGPIPPVSNESLKNHKAIARYYRNRRIGDFLKELHLTEGRATGLPKIRESLNKNGSPEPYFETDDDRTYFLTRLSIHSLFDKSSNEERKMEIQKTEGKELLLIEYIKRNGKITNKEARKLLGLRDKKAAQRIFIKLTEKGVITREGKGAATHYLMSNDYSEI